MKLVREHINEKFTEDGDSVRDMGIGMAKIVEEFIKYVNKDRSGDAFHTFPDEGLNNRILDWAAYYNRYDIVDYLIDIGVDINHGNGRSLRYAACAYNIQLGAYLVKKGADLNMAEIGASYSDNESTKQGLKTIRRAIKEKLYEAFTDKESDPIADMGIGGYSWETIRPGALIKLKPSYTSLVALSQNASGAFSNYTGMRIDPEHCLLVAKVINQNQKKEIYIYRFISDGNAYFIRDAWEKTGKLTKIGTFNIMIISKLQFDRRFEIIEKGFNSLVNEKFAEDSDSIADMGIGQRAQIKKWFETWAPDVKYTMDKDLNITVKDSLDLRGTQVTSLPYNLSVERNLDLQRTPITSLPDNLRIGGWLDLQETQITSLPDDLKIEGWFDMQWTLITSLPDNFSVGRSLYLYGTPITSLPDNLRIGENLYLSGTQITKLPDNLSVGGDLHIQETDINSLPANLSVGGNIHKDF